MRGWRGRMCFTDSSLLAGVYNLLRDPLRVRRFGKALTERMVLQIRLPRAVQNDTAAPGQE